MKPLELVSVVAATEISRVGSRDGLFAVPPDFPAALDGNLVEWVNKPTFADVVFSVDGTSFHGHRFVLAARSPYFSELLTQLAGFSNLELDIEIRDSSPEDFLAILTYMYSGPARVININAANVWRLFQAARVYKLDQLLMDTQEYMASSISIDTVIQLWKVSQEAGAALLAQRCSDYFSSNLNAVINTKGFNSFGSTVLMNQMAKTTPAQQVPLEQLLSDPSASNGPAPAIHAPIPASGPPGFLSAKDVTNSSSATSHHLQLPGTTDPALLTPLAETSGSDMDTFTSPYLNSPSADSMVAVKTEVKTEDGMMDLDMTTLSSALPSHHHHHHHHHDANLWGSGDLVGMNEFPSLLDLAPTSFPSTDPSHRLSTSAAALSVKENMIIEQLESLLNLVISLLVADRATLFLHEKKSDELCSWVVVGDRTCEIRIPANLGIAGHVFQSGELLHVPDAYHDPRFLSDVDQVTGYRTRQLIAVPLVLENGCVIGVMEALNKQHADQGFSDMDISNIKMVAHLVAALLDKGGLETWRAFENSNNGGSPSELSSNQSDVDTPFVHITNRRAGIPAPAGHHPDSLANGGHSAGNGTTLPPLTSPPVGVTPTIPSTMGRTTSMASLDSAKSNTSATSSNSSSSSKSSSVSSSATRRTTGASSNTKPSTAVRKRRSNNAGPAINATGVTLDSSRRRKKTDFPIFHFRLPKDNKKKKSASAAAAAAAAAATSSS